MNQGSNPTQLCWKLRESGLLLSPNQAISPSCHLITVPPLISYVSSNPKTYIIHCPTLCNVRCIFLFPLIKTPKIKVLTQLGSKTHLKLRESGNVLSPNQAISPSCHLITVPPLISYHPIQKPALHCPTLCNVLCIFLFPHKIPKTLSLSPQTLYRKPKKSI